MSDVVIRAENLGKQYTRGKRQGYETLRERLTRLGTAPLRAVTRAFGAAGEETNGNGEQFWALRDVSFKVKRGEVVGIIGRNGAGKSTLLKILSRITEPTTGWVEIDGRVASLLEVGTGFHPELTGRENVYLNGAILGMPRAEIARKFDEIVAFAEVEESIDTAVKFYSSGMYLRLAFAVAAHLEPEILIVDEVLAVGDVQFQKKCLGKMGEVAKGGRTVLFVSHNMSAVQALCTDAVVLDRGQVVFVGIPSDSVSFYVSRNMQDGTFVRKTGCNGIGVFCAKVCIQETNGQVTADLIADVQSDRTISVTIDLRLADQFGNACGFGSLGTLDPTSLVRLEPGLNRVVGRFDFAALAVGRYMIGLDVTQPDIGYFDRLENCFAFEIHAPPRPPAIRRVQQNWGYGSIELPSTLVKVRPVSSSVKADAW
jgi:lipopolysaccharide transport system ATP-binding protein